MMMMMMMMVMKIKIGELYSFQPSLRRARFCADARSLQGIAKMQELDLQWICKQYDKCATVGCVRQAVR